MKKRTSLDSIFNQPDGNSMQTEAATPRLVPAPVKPRRKRHPSIYMPDVVHEQLRKLGFEESRKMHSYFMEGLDRVFQDRGLPSIKHLTASHPYTLTPHGYISDDEAQ
jgi:hypothetical protein